MTLDEFHECLTKDVERFKDHWLQQHKDTAANSSQTHADYKWPLMMDEGDWYDMFLAFMETGE